MDKRIWILLVGFLYQMNKHSMVCAKLCHVTSSEDVVVLDIMESTGDEFNQPTSPEQLPIDGSLEEIFLTLLPDATNYFTLVDKSLRLQSVLDRDAEDLSSIVLRVSCQVVGSSYSRTIPVIVRVTDINDNSPEFINLPYRVQIPENTGLGSVVFRDVRARDSDAGVNALTEYRLEPGDGGATDGYGRFSIARSHNGVVTVTKPLDYETTDVYYLTVVANDRSQRISSRRSSTTTLTVSVQDSDDQGPGFVTVECLQQHTQCTTPTYRASVISTELAGLLDIKPERIHAVDRDSLGYDVQYLFVSGTPSDYSDYFSIDPLSGQVKQIRALDRTKVKRFQIAVQATERSSKARSSIAQFLVDVKAVDSSPPVLTATSTEGYVLENSALGTRVMVQPNSPDLIRLQVDDSDWSSGDPDMDYSYELTSDAFRVDRDGYLVVAKHDLDRDPPSPDTLTFQVVAREAGALGRASMPVTLTVHLLDLNDNSPLLPMYRTMRIPAGDGRRRIVQVRAADPDAAGNGDISYTLVHVSHNGRRRFAMDARTGELYVMERVFTGEQFSISVQAADRGGRRSQTVIEVLVVPGPNSAGPVFQQILYDVTVSEGAGIGSIVLTVQAVDPESDPVTYSLVEGTGGKTFAIGPTTGTISLLAKLDREQITNYILIVKGSDVDGLFSTSKVKIEVADINDKNPQFIGAPYTFQVKEGQRNQFIGRIRAVDEDSGLNGAVFYSLPEQTQFSIDPQSGEIRTRGQLDYEQQPVHQLVVTASDGSVEVRQTTATVAIHVIDIPDEPPRFPHNVYRASVVENQPHSHVVRVQALDLDSEPSIHYVIRDGPRHLFSVHPDTGVLSTVRGLNYETSSRYVLLVGTDENTSGAPDSSATVFITVEDRNDIPPVFDQLAQRIDLSDLTSPGHVIGSVHATDSDGTAPANQVRYMATGQSDAVRYFSVDPQTGDISVRDDLRSGQRREYQLEVTAYDLGTPQLAASTVIHIFVEPSHQSPVFSSELTDGVGFAATEVAAEVTENAVENTLVKTLSVVNGHTRGSPVRCEIIDGNRQDTFYAVMADHDRACQIRVRSGHIDHERLVRYRLTVRLRSADDRGVNSQRDMATLSIAVRDSNDHRPEFTFDTTYRQMTPHVYLAAIDRQAKRGTHVLTVKVRDQDVGHYGRMTYRIVPDSDRYGYFAIDSTSGTITNIRTFRGVKPEYLPFNLTIVAMDGSSSGEIMDVQVSVLVNLITVDNRMILVIRDVDSEAVKKSENTLIRVLQDQSGLVIGVESIESHRYANSNGSVIRDLTSTDVCIHAIDPNTGAILSRRSRSINRSLTGDGVQERITYFLSANLGMRVQAIRAPLTAFPTTTTRPVILVRRLAGYQVALVVLAGVATLLIVCGSIYMCWRCCCMYWCHRGGGRDGCVSAGKSDEAMIVPKYEPYVLEPSLKEYETQVLQMNVPPDDVSADRMPLDLRFGDRSHQLSLDNISYITKDGCSSHGKDSGHVSPCDSQTTTAASLFDRTPTYNKKNELCHQKNGFLVPAVSATNDNVTFKQRNRCTYLSSPSNSVSHL